MFDTTARAKLEILAGARQESSTQHGREALFGYGAALAPTVHLHDMTPPPASSVSTRALIFLPMEFSTRSLPFL
jgi:hypothetical protein